MCWRCFPNFARKGEAAMERRMVSTSYPWSISARFVERPFYYGNPIDFPLLRHEPVNEPRRGALFGIAGEVIWATMIESGATWISRLRGEAAIGPGTCARAHRV